MNKRKENFFKLKNKLEKIFFKKVINIIPKKFNLDLSVINLPKYENLSIPSKEKPKLKILNTIKTKFNYIGKNIGLDRIKFKHNIDSISLKNANVKGESIDDSIELTQKNKEFKNKFNYIQLKDNKILSSKNYTKLNYINNLQNLNNYGLRKNAYDPTKSSYNLNYKNYIDGNTANLKNKQLEKTTYSGVEIKYIEKPSDLKNIKQEDVANLNDEIDLKHIVAPTKNQIISLKEYLIHKKLPSTDKVNTLRKATKIRTSTTQMLRPAITEKSSVTEKLSSKKLSNTDTVTLTNFEFKKPVKTKNKTEIKKIVKKKSLYVLPAFMAGMEEPLSSAIIGKIHAGETIKPISQAQRSPVLEGKFSKEQKFVDLKSPEPKVVAGDEPSKRSEKLNKEEKKSEQEKTEEKEENDLDEIYKELKRIENLQKQYKLDENDIPKNRKREALFYDRIKKTMMPPVWRTSLG